MTADDGASEAHDAPTLQAKLEAGIISEAEYARLTALRFGEDPATFDFGDAADFYGLTETELRAEIDWLAGEE